MNLADITPLILAYNEAPNIRDTLERVSWAKRIVIVDSFSSDETLPVVRTFPQVVVYQRSYDHFADQCNFGLSKIDSRWTLSLDADYKCPRELVDELLTLDERHIGYQAGFRYCVFGRPLRGTLYPPRVVLYQTEHAQYRRDGHAHRVCISGDVAELKTRILHDDRKPLSTWLSSQATYARKEAEKLRTSPADELAWQDRLRKRIVFAPLLTLFYCLFVKRLILDGWRGVFYTMQRVYAELLLSLMMLEARIRPDAKIEKTEKGTPSPNVGKPVIVESDVT